LSRAPVGGVADGTVAHATVLPTPRRMRVACVIACDVGLRRPQRDTRGAVGHSAARSFTTSTILQLVRVRRPHQMQTSDADLERSCRAGNRNSPALETSPRARVPNQRRYRERGHASTFRRAERATMRWETAPSASLRDKALYVGPCGYSQSNPQLTSRYVLEN
jgi:hypothetical protein